MNKNAIIHTNDNCIGCNKCIKVCSAIGACISKQENGKDRIIVDENRCVACGSCIDVCEHNAREFIDDAQSFFDDLKRGEKISLLLAPAFKANYPDRYESILGGLKAMGVNRILSVSFGADITTWGYLNYITKYNFYGGISQPCPALVAYIERYIPELIPKLFPVQSPLMCAAIYARKVLGITDKLAFISPCIAKKMEIDDPHNEGLVQYNVTFEHLIKYADRNEIEGYKAKSEIEYGLGSFYPTPGGLAENVKWFLGDDIFIRQVEGEKHLYEWLHQNTDRIKNDKTPFLFIDALNCEKGCICGTAVDNEKSKTDDALYELLNIRERSKKNSRESPWGKDLTPAQRLEKYNKQFEDLVLEDFLRGYTDRSESCAYLIPSENELNEIFLSMNKDTEESRHIDCTCCGYENCRQMATAIYNGFNHKENCIYYEKMMVKELATEKALAEAAAKAKGSFLANMSHEIRTPINAILGMDELILRESGEESIKEYASNIRRSGDLLLSLINNILDFSKIEAGKLELIPVDYDIAMLIQDTDNMIRSRMELKGLKFNIHADENIPRFLFGDQMRIEQCIINILTNSLKYTEKGSVDFKIELDSRSSDSARIRFRCIDTGIGIKEDDIKNLFSAFERIEESRNRKIEGTGLGMNIVQSLLSLMNSHLEVNSVYGRGSEFSFAVDQIIRKDLPLGKYDELEKINNDQDIYKNNLYIAPDARVLIVDDAAMNLIVAKGFLKRTLVKVDTAESARDALELLAENEYDVLFYDHMMPETDGIELLKLTRQLKDNPNQNKPCIVLTANAIKGVREEYINTGFDDYMSKPLEGHRFESLLRNYLPSDKVKDVDQSNEEKDKTDLSDLPEKYINLTGIALETGIKNCGSVKDFESLLQIFYSSLDQKKNELDTFFAQGDYNDYTIKVHAFKSSARLIGALSFADDAQNLEYAGKAGDIEYIKANHSPFMYKCESLKEILSPLYEESECDEKTEADESFIKESFDRIKDAAESMDTDTLEEIIDQLKNYKLSGNRKDIFDSILECFDMFDYDGIVEKLS